jgi:dihydrodipicolinate synthase/N-acetylneuraminate lyase
VQLCNLARQNEWQQARALQTQINEVIAIGLRYPVHASVKAMLMHLGIDCGGCIPPRRNLSEQELHDLKQHFAQTQFLQS